jgi:hypothetical protein
MQSLAQLKYNVDAALQLAYRGPSGAKGLLNF